MLAIGDADVPFELRRSKRRRTLGLTVTPHQVRIHAPSWTPRAEIEHYVLRQHDWLKRAWTRMQACVPLSTTEPLAGVRYLGRVLALDVRDSLFCDVRRDGDTLRVQASLDADIPALVRDWLYIRATSAPAAIPNDLP